MPVARWTDPETSWQAARSVAHVRESQAKVYACLALKGPSTDEEIVAFHRETFGPVSVSGCRTRRRELVDRGLVLDTGRRSKTAAKRNTIVWRAISLSAWRADYKRTRPQYGKRMPSTPPSFAALASASLDFLGWVRTLGRTRRVLARLVLGTPAFEALIAMQQEQEHLTPKRDATERPEQNELPGMADRDSS